MTMTLRNRLRRSTAAATAFVFLAVAYPVAAQELTDEHIRAARAAISAIQATDAFDMILPEASVTLKNELIQRNPDLVSLINRTVDDKAIELAARRADLEREAALIYARSFSEEELNSIAQFYDSEAGRKLLETGPVVSREVYRAAEIWQGGILRDLAQNVGQALSREVGSSRVDTDVELDPVIQ